MNLEEKRPFCLLDTCIVSDFFKDDVIKKNLIDRILYEKYSYCITIQTMAELYKTKYLYDHLIDDALLLGYPLLLKNYELLFEEEIKSYPNQNNIDPFYLLIQSNHKPIYETEVLKKYFYNEDKDNAGVFSYLTSLNPSLKTYNKKNINEFIELNIYSLLIQKDINFFKKYDNIDYNYFKSWKMMILNVIYKFYRDNRKPILSDVNDILITCVLPYVDVFITEKNQADLLRKIQNKFGFITHLEILTLPDIKKKYIIN